MIRLLIFSTIAIAVGVFVPTAIAQVAEVDGRLLDRLVERLDKRLDKLSDLQTASFKDAEEMFGRWRQDFGEQQEVGRQRWLKDFTPIKNGIQRTEDAVVALRSLVWQVVGTIVLAVLALVVLVLVIVELYFWLRRRLRSILPWL